MTKEIVILLGRRDFPTDGVADNCDNLAKELRQKNYNVEIVKVPWQEKGILKSYQWLWQESEKWSGKWILLQYTNYSWPARGFPFGFLLYLWILKQRKCLVGITCHERYDYQVYRLIDKLRRFCQSFVLRTAYNWTNKSILTLPIKVTPWLPINPSKAVTIQVGSNIPEPEDVTKLNNNYDGKTVVVFGITGGTLKQEIIDICYALKASVKKVPKLRLLALGRNTDNAKELLEKELTNTSIELTILGLLSPEEVTQNFLLADVFLFIRGCISTGRSSAISGLACGLPTVGYYNDETDYPLTEAGLMLVPEGDKEALAFALTHVLTDNQLRENLRNRTIKAYQKHFAWQAIAQKFINVLQEAENE